MILSTILNFARTQAQSDSNGITDASGIIWANEGLQDFHRRLVAAGVDASQIQESYTSGVVGTGTYLYPTDMMFLKAIELNYTDTSANNYKQATQIDISNIPGGSSFSWLRGNANKQTPLFDDHGDWFEVFPTFTSADNVSQAIRIFYFLKPTEYTSVSDTVAYPENLDTTLLGWRVAAMYYYSLGNIPDGDAFTLKYEERVKQYITTLAKGVQTPQQTVPLQIDGWRF